MYSSRGVVVRSMELYKLYCPNLQKHGSTEDPLYSLYHSIHIYVYPRNRRDSFFFFLYSGRKMYCVQKNIFGELDFKTH